MLFEYINNDEDVSNFNCESVNWTHYPLYVLSVNVVIFIFLCAGCQGVMATKKPPEQLVAKVVF